METSLFAFRQGFNPCCVIIDIMSFRALWIWLVCGPIVLKRRAASILSSDIPCGSMFCVMMARHGTLISSKQQAARYVFPIPCSIC